MTTSITTKPILSTVVFCLLWTAATVTASISIDTVTVGNPGNGNDSNTGNQYGGVSYTYAIGTYEVTWNQYAAFLNAVAATDTYSLYHPFMGTDDTIAGISQEGSSGGYTYSVMGDGQRPVTYVNWSDAVRFTNWLHNAQPIGAQANGTTEDGAYTLNGQTPTNERINKDPNARYWLPSESEWYKAAYYDPTLNSGSGAYWLYPMQTNSEPYSSQPPGAIPGNTHVGNFRIDDGIVNGYNDGYAVTGLPTFSFSQNYLTNAGAYAASGSYFGTFDQGGNVREWMDGVAGPFSVAVKRGGAWYDTPDYSQASFRDVSDPSFEDVGTGFRVATLVPEPASAVLLLGGGALLSLRRRSVVTV